MPLFPTPRGRSKTADVRKVARLYLRFSAQGETGFPGMNPVSEALGAECPVVFFSAAMTRDEREEVAAWQGYCKALWEAAPGFLAALLTDSQPEPQPEPRHQPGKSFWERLVGN